jgi:peptidyl-prolyl cis-trans isomerase D
MRSRAKYVWFVIFGFFIVGFLLLDTSGLLSGDAVTPNTVVAEVNGRDILYTAWATRVQGLSEAEAQQQGRALTLDEIDRVEDRAFDELVSEVLLEQEYRKRGITVSPEEIRAAAVMMPPPGLMQNPELQTEGRFDPVKYQRFLGSPVAATSGLLLQLESYYRQEIPRQKLFEQIAADVYLTDARMWDLWQDVQDSAQVSFVALTPDVVADSAVTVTDREIQTYYDENKATLERTGRAVVSVMSIPRVITAADTAAVRARAVELRNEITGGTPFEEVAARESADSISGANGGSLGRGARGRFIEAFERAAYALRPGEVSQPVLTSFGYHIIKLDERKGDTVALRHILLRIEQSDSSATATDRRADELDGITADATNPAQFDSAAARLGLTPMRAVVVEGEPLMVANAYIPSVSAWAFSGAQPGETSELFDSPEGYFVARLDSLTRGGPQELEEVRDEIRTRLLRTRKIETLLPAARTLASRAAATSLEAAAAEQKVEVSRTGLFNRIDFVPGIGQGNEAVGSAFALSVGAVGAPVATEDAVFVIRVDRRINASREKWEAQKQVQRGLLTGSLREERVRTYLEDLRASAKIEDHRREINAAARRLAA